MRVRYRFDEVALQGNKVGKCACGKRLKRQQKFYQTLNPFNRKVDGTAKTRQDIYAELKKDIEAWKSEPILCKDCSLKGEN